MKDIRTGVKLFIVLTVLCGAIYPALVTGVARVLFPKEAAGSFVTDASGTVVGSALIGQPFSDARYFWPRPSATPGFGYNPLASGGSNAGPTNPEYFKSVAARIKALRDSGVTSPVPAELVQASASGLDPHISPEAALLQASRVAKARGLSEAMVRATVSSRIEGRQFGFLGAPRVNLLALNLALDRLHR